MTPKIRNSRRLMTVVAAVGAVSLLAACQTTGADTAQTQPSVTKSATADGTAAPKRKLIQNELSGGY